MENTGFPHGNSPVLRLFIHVLVFFRSRCWETMDRDQTMNTSLLCGRSHRLAQAVCYGWTSSVHWQCLSAVTGHSGRSSCLSGHSLSWGTYTYAVHGSNRAPGYVLIFTLSFCLFVLDKSGCILRLILTLSIKAYFFMQIYTKNLHVIFYS